MCRLPKTHFWTLSLGVLLLGASCAGNRPTSENPHGTSSVTGLEYGETADAASEGIFPVLPYRGQPDAPNMVKIEGGRMVMGSFAEDVWGHHDNLERTVSINTFFMDQTEIANIHWLEYMFYVEQDSSGTPEGDAFVASVAPNERVWVSNLSFNDPYEDHYLRYPGFRFYPVVGINWKQAQDYCKWRTSYVNYKLASDSDPDILDGLDTVSRLPLESGVVVPDFRLPTEAEWEYAAKAMIGTQWQDENQTHQRLYPWDGHALRNPYGNQMGNFLANFKRGRGDYAGIAGKLNDGALITDYIYAYPPNDFNLYNMAGNVNEWVEDTYRVGSFQQFDDLNPFRGGNNDAKEGFLDPTRDYAPDNSLVAANPKVYKGGSWADQPYWLSPGTRRYLARDSSTSTIGFRCAMIRAGSNY